MSRQSYDLTVKTKLPLCFIKHHDYYNLKRKRKYNSSTYWNSQYWMQVNCMPLPL